MLELIMMGVVYNNHANLNLHNGSSFQVMVISCPLAYALNWHIRHLPSPVTAPENSS